MKIYRLNVQRGSTINVDLVGYGFHIIKNPRSHTVRVLVNADKTDIYWANTGLSYHGRFTKLQLNAVPVDIYVNQETSSIIPIIIMVATSLTDVLPASLPINYTVLDTYLKWYATPGGNQDWFWSVYYDGIFFYDVPYPVGSSYGILSLDNYANNIHFDQCAEISANSLYPCRYAGGVYINSTDWGYRRMSSSLSELGAEPSTADSFIINKWMGWLDTRSTIGAMNFPLSGGSGATYRTLGPTVYSYVNDRPQDHGPNSRSVPSNMPWYNNALGFNTMFCYTTDTNHGITVSVGIPINVVAQFARFTLFYDPNLDPLFGL